MLVEAYASMVDRCQEKCYFMWDALKDALILEVKEQRQELIVELCNLPDRTPAKRDILIEVLTEFGVGWPDRGQAMLDRLVQEARHIDAALIAIEVAYNLRKLDVLERMAQHRDATVRRTAAQFIYYVWEADPDAALDILRHLAARVRRAWIPPLKVLDSCVNISLLILLGGFQDAASIEALRRVWTRLLDKLLFRAWDRVPVIGRASRRLREGVLWLAAHGMWYLVGQMWESDPLTTFDRKDIGRFFKRDPEIRQRAIRIVSYLDVDADLEDGWDDFVKVIEGEDYFSILLTLLVLSARGLQYDEAISSPRTNPTIPYIKRLLDHALALEPARPAIPYVIMALSSTGRCYRAETVDDAFLATFEDALHKYYTNHGCRSRDSRGHEYKVPGFGFYVQLLYLKDANLDSDLLRSTVQTAFSREDYDFLERYVADVGGVSPGRRIWPALRALRPVLNALMSSENEQLAARLEEDLIEALSIINIYAPRKVDQFITTSAEQNETLRRIRRQIEAKGREEPLGSMTLSRLIWFIRDGILLNPDKFILNQFMWWLRQAVACQSTAAAFGLLMRLLINLVYLPDNDAVFATPDLRSTR
jgi:hypothetical protein